MLLFIYLAALNKLLVGKPISEHVAVRRVVVEQLKLRPDVPHPKAA